MSVTDPTAGNPTSYNAATTAAAVKPTVSVFSVIAFILAVATAIGYMTAKTLDVIMSDNTDSTSLIVATVFGWFGLLSIVLIGATIVLGHLGARKALAVHRARVLGIIGLGVGYLFLALYFNRLMVSVIALLTVKNGADFVQNNFYWV